MGGITVKRWRSRKGVPGCLQGSSGGGEADICSNSCRGQYSDAVLSELENQNDAEVEGISAKVKMLKDVRPPLPIPIPLSH